VVTAAAAAGLGCERRWILYRKIVMVGTTYAIQTVSSSQVVAGEKLKMPLSRVPYQLVGGMALETSKAR
jgi:hypothetical protein